MPELLAVYTHRGTRAVQYLVEYAPSTGGLALWVGHRDVPTGEDAPLIATDGHTVSYDAAFEALSLAEQAGLVAHEVLHIGLRHAQRYLDLRQLVGDVDLRLFNICADAIVNSTIDHLSWLVLPKGSVGLDRLLEEALGLKQPVEKSLLEWDVERLYRAIDDRRRNQSGVPRDSSAGERGGTGKCAPATVEARHLDGREDGPRSARVRALGASILADLRPDPNKRSAPEGEADEAREWSERILRGHINDGAYSLLRALIADVPRTRTPWEHVLRTWLAKGLARRPDLSWSRPSRSYLANQGRGGVHRRLPWEPGITTAKRVPRLVVVVDVSGSIEDKLMDRFAREIEAISRRQEAGLALIVGDDQVRHVAHFPPGRSGLREIAFEGGGGTDFTPLLQEADMHRPDLAVVLTDLDGPVGFKPRWPVVWVVPEAHASAVQPFGRKLVLR